MVRLQYGQALDGSHSPIADSMLNSLEWSARRVSSSIRERLVRWAYLTDWVKDKDTMKMRRRAIPLDGILERRLESSRCPIQHKK